MISHPLGKCKDQYPHLRLQRCSVVISIIASFCLLIPFRKRTDEAWIMSVDYCKPIQVVNSDAVILLSYCLYWSKSVQSLEHAMKLFLRKHLFLPYWYARTSRSNFVFFFFFFNGMTNSIPSHYYPSGLYKLYHNVFYRDLDHL